MAHNEGKLQFRVDYQGLKDYASINIRDNSPFSDRYFNIVEFPEKLTSGKNLFKLKAYGGTLVRDSKIHIEILDSNGDPIYYETLNYREQDGTRVIAVYIFPETPTGTATVYVAGRARRGPNNELIRFSRNVNDLDYINQPNIIWSRQVTVAPYLKNKTEIIFLKNREPAVTMQELVQPYLQPIDLENVLLTKTGSATSRLTITDIPAQTTPTMPTQNPASQQAATTQGQQSHMTLPPNQGAGALGLGNAAANNPAPAESAEVFQIQSFSMLETFDFPLSASMEGGQITIHQPKVAAAPGGDHNILIEDHTNLGRFLAVPASQRDEATMMQAGSPVTMSLSGSYTFQISDVLSSTRARVYQINGFANPVDNTIGGWVANVGATEISGGFVPTAYFVDNIAESSNFTSSHIEPYVTELTEKSQSFAEIVIRNTEPATGDVYKVRTEYKPGGQFGDFIDLGDTVIEQLEILEDTGSVEAQPSIGAQYNKIGFFTGLSDFESYWNTGSVSGLQHTSSVHFIELSAASASATGSNATITLQSTDGTIRTYMGSDNHNLTSSTAYSGSISGPNAATQSLAPTPFPPGHVMFYQSGDENVTSHFRRAVLSHFGHKNKLTGSMISDSRFHLQQVIPGEAGDTQIIYGTEGLDLMQSGSVTASFQGGSGSFFQSQNPLTASYHPDSLMSGVRFTPKYEFGTMTDVTSSHGYGYFHLKNEYLATVTEGTRYVFKMSAFANDIYESTDPNVPFPRLDVYISGSQHRGGILPNAQKLFSNPYQTSEIDVASHLANTTLDGDDGKLGTRITTFEFAPSQSLREVGIDFTSVYNDKIDVYFVIRRGLWTVANVSIKTYQETGYTPNYVRINKRIPTEFLKTPLTFKFKYFDYTGKQADVFTMVDQVYFVGENSVFGGENNLISGSFYIGNMLYSGMELAGGNSAYMRSVPYKGWTSGSRTDYPGGVFVWSGSVLPHEAHDDYTGVGLELINDSGSYFRFRTKSGSSAGAGSLLEIKTDTFFLGSEDTSFISGSGDGTIALSSSNFVLDTLGNVSMQGTITATAGGTIGGFNIGVDNLNASNFELSTVDTRLVLGSTASNNVFVVDGNEGMWLGNASMTSAPFAVKLDGTVSASKGLIAGWTINSTQLVSQDNKALIQAGTTPEIYIKKDASNIVKMNFTSNTDWGMKGTVDGNDRFQLGAVNQIASWSFTDTEIKSKLGINSLTEPGILLKSVGTIQTDPFISGLTANAFGWQIRSDGRAEFENVVVRVTLSTAVFEKDTISVVGGQVMVANAAVVDTTQPRYITYPYIVSPTGERLNYSGETLPVTSSHANIFTANANASIIVEPNVEVVPNTVLDENLWLKFTRGGTGDDVAFAIDSGSISKGTHIRTTFYISASGDVNLHLTTGSSATNNFISYKLNAGAAATGQMVTTGHGTKFCLVEFAIPDSPIHETKGIKYVFRNDSNKEFFIRDFHAMEATQSITVEHGGGWVNGEYAVMKDVDQGPDGRAGFVREYVKVLSQSLGKSEIPASGTLDLTASNANIDENTNIFVSASKIYAFRGVSSTTADNVAQDQYYFVLGSTKAQSLNNLKSKIQEEVLDVSVKVTGSTPGVVDQLFIQSNGVGTDGNNYGAQTGSCKMKLEGAMAKDPPKLHVERNIDARVQGNERGYFIDRLRDGQSIASQGAIDTGYILLNSQPTDDNTPYIDIVQRTGSGYGAQINSGSTIQQANNAVFGEVTTQARVGDLSGITDFSFTDGVTGYGIYTGHGYFKGKIEVTNPDGGSHHWNFGGSSGSIIPLTKLVPDYGYFNPNPDGTGSQWYSTQNLRHKVQNGCLFMSSSNNNNWEAELRSILTFNRSDDHAMVFDFTVLNTTVYQMIGWGDTTNTGPGNADGGFGNNAHALYVANNKFGVYEGGNNIFTTLVSGSHVDAGAKYRAIIRPNRDTDGARYQVFKHPNLSGSIADRNTAGYANAKQDMVLDVGLWAYKDDGDTRINVDQIQVTAPGAQTTVIDGGTITTGKIKSTNYAADAGSELDLDDGTFKLGGRDTPDLHWDGTSLIVSGAMHVTSGNVSKSMAELTLTSASFAVRISNEESASTAITQTANAISLVADGAHSGSALFLLQSGSISTRITNSESASSAITQTVDTINLEVVSNAGSISSLTLDSASFSTRVTNEESASTAITQTADAISLVADGGFSGSALFLLNSGSISTGITDAYSASSAITQTADAINLEVVGASSSAALASGSAASNRALISLTSESIALRVTNEESASSAITQTAIGITLTVSSAHASASNASASAAESSGSAAQALGSATNAVTLATSATTVAVTAQGLAVTAISSSMSITDYRIYLRDATYTSNASHQAQMTNTIRYMSHSMGYTNIHYAADPNAYNSDPTLIANAWSSSHAAHLNVFDGYWSSVTSTKIKLALAYFDRGESCILFGDDTVRYNASSSNMTADGLQSHWPVIKQANKPAMSASFVCVTDAHLEPNSGLATLDGGGMYHNTKVNGIPQNHHLNKGLFLGQQVAAAQNQGSGVYAIDRMKYNCGPGGSRAFPLVIDRQVDPARTGMGAPGALRQKFQVPPGTVKLYTGNYPKADADGAGNPGLQMVKNYWEIKQMISGSTSMNVRAIPNAFCTCFAMENDNGGRLIYASRNMNRWHIQFRNNIMEWLLRRDPASQNLDERQTVINGDRIKTGVLTSANFNEVSGSQINLNNATFKFGGSSTPRLEWNGASLAVRDNVGAIVFSSGNGIYNGNETMRHLGQYRTTDSDGSEVNYLLRDYTLNSAAGTTEVDMQGVPKNAYRMFIPSTNDSAMAVDGPMFFTQPRETFILITGIAGLGWYNQWGNSSKGHFRFAPRYKWVETNNAKDGNDFYDAYQSSYGKPLPELLWDGETVMNFPVTAAVQTVMEQNVGTGMDYNKYKVMLPWMQMHRIKEGALWNFRGRLCQISYDFIRTELCKNSSGQNKGGAPIMDAVNIYAISTNTAMKLFGGTFAGAGSPPSTIPYYNGGDYYNDGTANANFSFGWIGNQSATNTTRNGNMW